jgi:glycosyltransferase involved in cell wall biosynthesis
VRILEVCPAYYPSVGGVEEHVRKISESLSKKYEVTVVTSDFPRGVSKPNCMAGVNIKRFRYFAPGGAYFFSADLERYLKNSSNDFDIVHAHSYHALPALYAAKAKKSNGLIFTPHYIGPGSTLFRRILHIPYRYIAGVIFERSDRIICTSKYEENSVNNRWKNVEGKIALIPNGVDRDNLRLQKKAKDYPSILCVSRLEKYKGVQYVIKALPSLNSNVILEVVGKGSYKQDLINLAKKMKVEERVRFYSYLSRSDLLQKYADSNVFVLLSERENFAICVAEALAARTPCIVTNRMALQEWIDDQNCFGIDFPIDTRKLSELINRVIHRKIAGIKLMTWEEVAEEVGELYESVLAERQ